jgi:hypothetical protein
LDARLTILLYKNISVSRPKEVKTRYKLAESSKEGYGSKRAVSAVMMIRIYIYIYIYIYILYILSLFMLIIYINYNAIFLPTNRFMITQVCDFLLRYMK